LRLTLLFAPFENSFTWKDNDYYGYKAMSNELVVGITMPQGEAV
jgi:hypothetical protein